MDASLSLDEFFKAETLTLRVIMLLNIVLNMLNSQVSACLQVFFVFAMKLPVHGHFIIQLCFFARNRRSVV